MPSARWSRCDPTSSVGRSWQREPHHLASGQARRDGQRRGRDCRPGELWHPRAPARRVPARDRRGDPARARACDAGPSPCGAPIPVRPGARGDAKAASRLRRAGARARARALDLQRVPSPRARAAGAARHCRPPPAQALRRRAGRRGGPRPRADRGARLGARSARPAAAGRPSRARADHRRAGAGRRRPGGDRVLTIEETGARAERVLAEIERAVVGKRDALELVLLGFLADGHVLIEDFPGLAKTLIARSFAQAFDMKFARIQFTPDLMPSDVTGSSIFNQRSRDDEWALLERRVERAADEIELTPVTDRNGLLELQQALEQVHVSPAVGYYIVDLVAATRASQRAQVGASPRGALALLKLARAKAVLDGRDFVTPEDVKAVAAPALSHRLMLRPELWVQRIRGDDVVREALGTVPTPKAEDVAGRSGGG